MSPGKDKHAASIGHGGRRHWSIKRAEERRTRLPACAATHTSHAMKPLPRSKDARHPYL